MLNAMRAAYAPNTNSSSGFSRVDPTQYYIKHACNATAMHQFLVANQMRLTFEEKYEMRSFIDSAERKMKFFETREGFDFRAAMIVIAAFKRAK
jgi:hypothetical protein